jgi:hypothetical protein
MLFVDTSGDGDRAGVLIVFDGVVEQIAKDLPDAIPIH